MIDKKSISFSHLISALLIIFFALNYHFDLLLILYFSIGVLFAWLVLLFDQEFLYDYYKVEPKKEIPAYITRSIVFSGLLIPLAFFVVTSTGSELGKGLILTLIGVIGVERFQYQKMPILYNDYFLNQLKEKLTHMEIKILNIVWFFLFFLLFLVAL